MSILQKIKSLTPSFLNPSGALTSPLQMVSKIVMTLAQKLIPFFAQKNMFSPKFSSIFLLKKPL